MLIIALSILTLAGFAALIHAVNRAAAGYETHSGFFQGIEQPPITTTAKAPEPVVNSSTATVNIGQNNTTAPKPKARKVGKKAKKVDSGPAFQMELDASFPECRGPELIRLMSVKKQVEAHR